MKQLTKKQIESLKVVERNMYTAVELQYKHNTTTAENDLVADCLDYVTGSKVLRNYGCGRCVFNMYERLGKIYFKQLKEVEETTTTTEETTTTTIATEETTTTTIATEETTTTTIATEETTTTTIAEENEPNQVINELEPKVTKTKNKQGRKGK